MLQNKIQQALQNAKNRGEDEGGFTLIELLVVILIIGILAAIALPTFLGQSNKAKDSSAKSDVRNAITQLESCLVDDTIGNCSGAGKLVNGVSIGATPAPTASNYALTATSATNNTFTITKTGAPGQYQRACTVPATGKEDGGCKNVASGVGDW